MPFPSYAFLFAFLPVALAGYFLCGRAGRHGARLAPLWLGLASLLFCLEASGPYSLAALILLAGSAYALGRPGGKGSPVPRLLCLLAFAAVLRQSDVMFLFHFCGTSIGRESWGISSFAVPWAFSFVLLGQAAYLVAVHRGGPASPSLASHLAWTLFFPRLPAGPPVSRESWDAQQALPGAFRFQPANMAAGLGLLASGLAKKVVLADNLSLLAQYFFDDLARKGHPGIAFAWIGTLAFAFQIYFELSGYADMALGAARMFNVVLPPVFDAPYRARSLSAFWSRWYAPLWRLGRELVPLARPGLRPFAPVVAFLALGMWHGMNIPFLAWGAWSGAALAVQRSGRLPRVPGAVAWTATFLAVLAGWVLFRLGSEDDAGTVFAALAGFRPAGESLPAQIAALFQGTEAKEYGLAFLALAASPFAALLGPSSERRFGPEWRPTLAEALGTALLLILSILCLPAAREFLYARF